jgi:hypothetical protein
MGTWHVAGTVLIDNHFQLAPKVPLPRFKPKSPNPRDYAKIGSGLLLGAVLLAIPCTGFATDRFEIQVYQADVDRPWQPSLEIHLNHTISGRKTPAYEGEQAPHHVGRLTLEPALGITEFLEVGGYLQNMLNADGHYRFAGWKLRMKWVIPERYTGRFFFGLNAEIGKVPRAVEEQGWANEFRPILGYYDGHWLFAINPIVGYALSGPDKGRPDLEPAAKLGFNTQYGFIVGAEYYAGLGYLTALPTPIAEQDHLLFLTFDLAERASGIASNAPPTPAKETPTEPWELNLGLGCGLTEATPQHVILKAIVGKAF